MCARVRLVRALSLEKRTSRWIRDSEPPDGRGSATRFGLIVRSSGPTSEMKSRNGCLASLVRSLCSLNHVGRCGASGRAGTRARPRRSIACPPPVLDVGAMMAAPADMRGGAADGDHDERTFGGQTQGAVPPGARAHRRAPALARWRGYGWRAEPDPAIAAEHEALCELLAGAGAEVVYAAGDSRTIPTRSTCSTRRSCPTAARCSFGRARRAVASSRRRSARTSCARRAIALEMRSPRPPRAATRCGSTSARSWSAAATGRTRPASMRCAGRCPTSRCSRSTCTGQGPEAGLHLLSLLSPLDLDLVVVYPPLMPIRLPSCSPSAASRSSRCPRRSSGRWARTSSRSPRGSPWRSTAAPRRAGGWRRGSGRQVFDRLRARAQGRRRADLPHPAAAPGLTRTAL